MSKACPVDIQDCRRLTDEYAQLKYMADLRINYHAFLDIVGNTKSSRFGEIYRSFLPDESYPGQWFWNGVEGQLLRASNPYYTRW